MAQHHSGQNYVACSPVADFLGVHFLQRHENRCRITALIYPVQCVSHRGLGEVQTFSASW